MSHVAKCSYCKQLKPVAIQVSKFAYCEQHAKFAPTKEKVDEYFRGSVKKSYFNDEMKKERDPYSKRKVLWR